MGGAFERPPIFHLRGIGVGHFTTLARHFGGAMVEVKVENGGSEDGDVAREGAGNQPDPEIDQVEAGRRVQKAAQKALLPNLDPIMLGVAEKAKSGHEPSIKMLIDLTLKPPADGGLAELPPSFAAELQEISERLLAEVEK